MKSTLTNIKDLLLRYGPLIAAFFVGLGSIPDLAAVSQQVLFSLGLLGVQPDPNAVAPATQIVPEIALLIGSIRKLWKLASLFKKK